MSRAIFLAVVIAVLPTSPAWAQTPADTSGLFIGGLGGAVFDPEASTLFAGQAGWQQGGWEVFGEVGRIQNVPPEGFEESIDLIANVIAFAQGAPVSLDGRRPAVYGLGVIRWSPWIKRLTPFAEGGVGMARLSVTFHGNADAAVLDELSEDFQTLEATKVMLTAGGGVRIGNVSRLSIDLGYRYFHIFTENPATNGSALYGAAHWRF